MDGSRIVAGSEEGMFERRTKRTFLHWTMAVGLLLSPQLLAQQQPAGPPDAQVQADAQKQLHGKQFRDVQVQVVNGVATLTGAVDLLMDKLDAEKRVARMHETASIMNQITVDVPPGITDQQIYNKLGTKLAYDREGYGTLPFNSITLQVQNGTALIGGEVVEPADKDSAIGLVTGMPGVRGIVDHLQVAPLSPDDWRIRRALFQAIYGAPQFQRYAIDPGKPIRIVVLNGHATLTGVVSGSGDREFAGIRANTVPGIFSVTNDLQVQGETPER